MIRLIGMLICDIFGDELVKIARSLPMCLIMRIIVLWFTLFVSTKTGSTRSNKFNIIYLLYCYWPFHPIVCLLLIVTLVRCFPDEIIHNHFNIYFYNSWAVEVVKKVIREDFCFNDILLSKIDASNIMKVSFLKLSPLY